MAAPGGRICQGLGTGRGPSSAAASADPKGRPIRRGAETLKPPYACSAYQSRTPPAGGPDRGQGDDEVGEIGMGQCLRGTAGRTEDVSAAFIAIAFQGPRF